MLFVGDGYVGVQNVDVLVDLIKVIVFNICGNFKGVASVLFDGSKERVDLQSSIAVTGLTDASVEDFHGTRRGTPVS